MVHFLKGSLVRIDVQTTTLSPARVEWMLIAKLA